MSEQLPDDIEVIMIELVNDRELYKAVVEPLHNCYLDNRNASYAEDLRKAVFKVLRSKYGRTNFPESNQPYRALTTLITERVYEYYFDNYSCNALCQCDVKYLRQNYADWQNADVKIIEHAERTGCLTTPQLALLLQLHRDKKINLDSDAIGQTEKEKRASLNNAYGKMGELSDTFQQTAGRSIRDIAEKRYLDSVFPAFKVIDAYASTLNVTVADLLDEQLQWDKHLIKELEQKAATQKELRIDMIRKASKDAITHMSFDPASMGGDQSATVIASKNLDTGVITFHSITLEEGTSTMNFNRTLPAVTTQTLIYGIEASSVEDADVFKVIQELENEITNLKTIKTKSKTVTKKIEATQAEIDKLVELIDTRAGLDTVE